MKKIAILTALAGAAVASSAMGQATIELRWVERSGQTSIGIGAVPGALNALSNTDATIWLILEGRLNTNGTSLDGIGGGAGDVRTNDALANGGWKVTATPRNASPASSVSSPGYTTGFNGDGDPLAAGRAIYNPYRFVANLGGEPTGLIDAPAVDPVNSSLGDIVWAAAGDSTAGLQAGFNTLARFGQNVFVPLYTFQYDVTTLGAANRTLSFSFDGTFTAFDNVDALGVPDSVVVPVSGPGSYNVAIIIPGPGAAALLGLGGLVAARRRRA